MVDGTDIQGGIYKEGERGVVKDESLKITLVLRRTKITLLFSSGG